MKEAPDCCHCHLQAMCEEGPPCVGFRLCEMSKIVLHIVREGSGKGLPARKHRRSRPRGPGQLQKRRQLVKRESFSGRQPVGKRKSEGHLRRCSEPMCVAVLIESSRVP